MPKWKDAFARSLDPDRETLQQFEFGAPATQEELAALRAAAGADIPAELSDMLSEFNGIWEIRDDTRSSYYFHTGEMMTAIEYYRDWDWPTDMLMECSQNILYVMEENGFGEMWGVVAKPFADFQPGQVVAFDHEEIGYAEEPADLFHAPYATLLELVAARYKRSHAGE